MQQREPGWAEETQTEDSEEAQGERPQPEYAALLLICPADVEIWAAAAVTLRKVLFHVICVLVGTESPAEFFAENKNIAGFDNVSSLPRVLLFDSSLWSKLTMIDLTSALQNVNKSIVLFSLSECSLGNAYTLLLESLSKTHSIQLSPFPSFLW